MTSDTLPLGRFEGKLYKIVYRPDYEIEDVEETDDFCITLVCKNPETEENEEVVTVDTAHGFVHIDLKFKEHPFKDDKIPLEHLDYCSAYEKGWITGKNSPGNTKEKDNYFTALTTRKLLSSATTSIDSNKSDK